MSQPSFFRTGSCFQVRVPAGMMKVPGKGEVPVVFARDAFTSLAGTVVPLTVRGEPAGHARVREADVADDGSSVLITYEITDLSPGQAGDDEPLGSGS